MLRLRFFFPTRNIFSLARAAASSSELFAEIELTSVGTSAEINVDAATAKFFSPVYPFSVRRETCARRETRASSWHQVESNEFYIPPLRGGARILRGIVEGQMEKNNDSRGGKCRFTDRWPPLPALLVSSENNDSSGGVFLVSFLPFFSFLFFV